MTCGCLQSATGQLWLAYCLWSRQYTFLQQSQVKGRKSICWHSADEGGVWQLLQCQGGLWDMDHGDGASA